VGCHFVDDIPALLFIVFPAAAAAVVFLIAVVVVVGAVDVHVFVSIAAPQIVDRQKLIKCNLLR